MTTITRRRLFQGTLAGGALAAGAGIAPVRAETTTGNTLAGRFYKTLKIGMVREGDTLAEKFAMAAEAGFDGIELSAPGYDIAEVNAAVQSSGLPVDGTVCAEHWNIRHSDPDPAVREKALEILLDALRDTHAVGGHTVLLVVGHGKDGSEEEVWQRSVENIRKAIPLASKVGVAIAIENVWNHFCYDHDGGREQSADKYAAYVDEFQSPWVAMQFDIGNHWKYGSMGDWIRTLDRRVLKLDVKGFSRELDKFTEIGAGDIDFEDVTRALLEIGFHGWCAAEVRGGGPEELSEIASAMDRVFGLV